jgi:hypothetical protein
VKRIYKFEINEKNDDIKKELEKIIENDLKVK